MKVVELGSWALVFVVCTASGADPGKLKGGLFHRCSHTHF